MVVMAVQGAGSGGRRSAPGTQALEGGRDSEQCLVPANRPDEMKADRQSATDGAHGMLIAGQPAMLANAVNTACPRGPTRCPRNQHSMAPSGSGLPIGFHLVGAVGRDETLLAVAAPSSACVPGPIAARPNRPPEQPLQPSVHHAVGRAGHCRHGIFVARLSRTKPAEGSMRKQLVLLTSALLGVFAAASHAKRPGQTIKIGALLPISGPGSYFGAQDKHGRRACARAAQQGGRQRPTSSPSSTRTPPAAPCLPRRRPSASSISTSPTSSSARNVPTLRSPSCRSSSRRKSR